MPETPTGAATTCGRRPTERPRGKGNGNKLVIARATHAAVAASASGRPTLADAIPAAVLAAFRPVVAMGDQFKMERALIGEMVLLPLADRQLGDDAGPARDRTAKQQNENAAVRHQEPDLPRPPREADEHGAQHVDGQQPLHRGEPAAVIDGESGRLCAIGALDEGRPPPV